MTNKLTTKETTALQPNETATHSERFLNKVTNEFGKNTDGELLITDYQRQLAQWYFIGIDRALKTAEEYRVSKNKNNRDPKYNNELPIVWSNVNMEDLAIDVVRYARVGLDMMQKNHINAIPYKNNTTGKYDIGFLPGYSGIQYIADKYALDKPLNVITELVYSTDTFEPIKKSMGNKVESYIFKINNAFNRGEIIGGFGYLEFTDETKNSLIIMTIEDIEKRKPAYAAAEFWGGKKTSWKDGKKEERNVTGWFAEMCLKTLKREVYSDKNIPRDPKKIDDNYIHMKKLESKNTERITEAEISENANQEYLDVEKEAVIMIDTHTDMETGEITTANSTSVQQPASIESEGNDEQIGF